MKKQSFMRPESIQYFTEKAFTHHLVYAKYFSKYSDQRVYLQGTSVLAGVKDALLHKRDGKWNEGSEDK